MSGDGINRVFLTGMVSAEPTFSQSPKGPCFKMLLTTSETIYKGKQRTEHNEEHKILIPSNLFKSDSSLYKNQWLCIQGRIKTFNLCDEQTVKRYDTWIIVTSMEGLPDLLDVRAKRRRNSQRT